MGNETAPRLIAPVPKIFFGPDAIRAKQGDKGILLGMRHAQWIDVRSFEPRSAEKIPALVRLRFASFHPWEAVGLGLPARAFQRFERVLLRDLVPGDVIVTQDGAVLHLGDMWHRTKLVRV